MELKKYVVIQMDGHKPRLWTREQYNDYISDCSRVGAAPAYSVITHFNGDEDLLTGQASPDGWVAAEKLRQTLHHIYGALIGMKGKGIADLLNRANQSLAEYEKNLPPTNSPIKG